ncbi:MAG TPA: sugar-binding domain-containing protein [Candidatus Limnocylindrales bacterium]
MANDGGSGKSAEPAMAAASQAAEPAEATGPTEATNLREMMRLVAQLYYVRELGQPEIAALTGFSISKVSRLLSAARAAGVVRIAVEGVPTAPTPIARALSAALDVEVWVTPGHETAPVLAARLCAVAAAPRLLDELPQEGAIGLTGGYTVESLVNALPAGSSPAGSLAAGSLPAGSLPARSAPPGSLPRVVVVPLVGGWDSSNPHLNSNEIARHMAERIGAGVRLLHAPGLLDNEATTAALLSDSAVTATTRYWGELKLALVGMSGAPRYAPGYGTVMDRLDEAGRTRLADKGAVGDVAGHLVRLDGSFVQDEWERRTISIPIETLRRVPRVIAIAAGSNKVETIVAGARTGLLHLLITDEPTAAAALELLRAGG